MFLEPHEQRLGREHTATDPRIGPFGLDPVPHPAGNGCPPGDDRRLSQGGGHSRSTTRSAERIKTKTGNFAEGVHRLRADKTGHFRGSGVHRLRGRTESRPERQRLRTVPRAHRRRAHARPQRDGDLARPRRRPRLLGSLRERPSVRRHTACLATDRGPRRDHDGTRRRRASRLWRRADSSARSPFSLFSFIETLERGPSSRSIA